MESKPEPKPVNSGFDGGLGGLTDIGTLDFDIGGAAKKEPVSYGAYNPSFGAAGGDAPRRPRRRIPQ